MQLAQANYARLRAPIDDPRIRDFVEAIDGVNALAEKADGFVWRYTTGDTGHALEERAFGSDVIFNMSVWTSIEALRAFVFVGGHLDIMRRRREWFYPGSRPTGVLWWVAAGHQPSVEEARARFERLHATGPTVDAFTFALPFAQPDAIP